LFGFASCHVCLGGINLFHFTSWGVAVWNALFVLALLGTISSTVFLLLVIVAAVRRRTGAARTRAAAAAIPRQSLPPVTVLKPVHGLEPRLEENLESFFQQDYPDLEIIFGARAEDDPALAIAEKLRRRYPRVKCRILLSGPPAWPSAKVYSLEKMIAVAGSDYLVITDSDVEVASGFLRNAVAPLLQREVGLVTCPYRGVPVGGLWSRLEALGMSVEMFSGVVVADMMEGMRFALGPAMAIRRDVLERIGGIAATKDYYADDFVLGNMTWAAGYKVVLSHEVVDHIVLTESFVPTFKHQLRWMKSTRYSRPKGHVGSGLTYAMPFGILGLISAAALGHPGLGMAVLGAAIANRVIQSCVVGWGVVRDKDALRHCWLYPLRDLLGFCLWAGSFTSREFVWGGEKYLFGKNGLIIPQHRPAATMSSEGEPPA
jgi:ceramide glucosyltransferase